MKNLARQRALRASLAVTLGGAALGMGCGTEPGGPADAGGDVSDAALDTSDAAGDVAVDVATDTVAEVSDPCSDEIDEMCPAECSADNDFDCCIEQDDAFTSCWYDPATGCGCAIEGPFVPPSLAA